MFNKITLQGHENFYSEILGKVKVTSPEQFVPLYLAFIDPEPVDTEFYYYPVNRNMIIPVIKGINKITSKVGQATLKLSLKRLLNKPYPTEYSLPLRLSQMLNNIYPSVRGGNVTSDSLRKVFTAEDLVNYYYAGRDLCILPFFFSRIVSAQYNVLRRGVYEAINSPSTIGINNVDPFMIGLVKAKHIPGLSARFALELPVELPYSDMKFVQANNFTGSEMDWMRSYGVKVMDFINRNGITVQFDTKENLRSYVVGEQNDSPIDVAKLALTLEEKHDH